MRRSFGSSAILAIVCAPLLWMGGIGEFLVYKTKHVHIGNVLVWLACVVFAIFFLARFLYLTMWVLRK